MRRSADRLSPSQVDAEFHAGWIALRFLDDPQRAAPHFDGDRGGALTPLSIARAYYWRGRAAEAMGEADEATCSTQRAAAYPIAYYGQLAARRLGRGAPRRAARPPTSPTGDERWRRPASSNSISGRLRRFR